MGDYHGLPGWLICGWAFGVYTCELIGLKGTTGYVYTWTQAASAGNRWRLFSSFPSSVFKLKLRPRKTAQRGGEGFLREMNGAMASHWGSGWVRMKQQAA